MRSFISRHESLFIVVGALVVFLGFVAKEGYREELRDFASQLQAAETSQDIAQGFLIVKSQLITIAEDEETTRVKTWPGTRDLFEEVTKNWLVSMDNALTAVDNLLNAFPKPDAQLQTRARKVHADIATLNGELKSFTEEAQNPAAEAVARQRIEVIDTQLLSFASTIKDLNNDVVDASYRQDDRLKKHVYWATRLEYLLFALGWALGLLGSLVKVPIVEPASPEES